MKKIYPKIKEFFERADMVLFTLCLICSLFGITAISSATKSMHSSQYVIVQTACMFIGIALFVLFTIVVGTLFDLLILRTLELWKLCRRNGKRI